MGNYSRKGILLKKFKNARWINTFAFFFIIFIFAACSATPNIAQTTTIQPTTNIEPNIPSATPPATATSTPLPTETPLPTPTPIPTLEGFPGVPDPRISNPELFDLEDPDAPIPQFANAMQMAGIEITGEQVAQGITFTDIKSDGSLLVDSNGNPFVIAIYNLDPDLTKTGEVFENSSLLIFQKNENEEWEWKILAAKNWVKFFKNKYGEDFIIGYQLASSNSRLTRAIKNNFNLSMIDGPLDWKNISKLTIDLNISSSDNTNPVTLKLDLSTVISYIRMNDLTDNSTMTFQHVVWGLKSSTFSETSDDLVNLGGVLKNKDTHLLKFMIYINQF